MILSQFICHIFAPVAFRIIGNPLPYSSVSLKCSPWPDALNLTIHSSSSTPSPVYHSSPTSCGFTDGWVSIHVTVVFCAPTCSAKLCRKRLAVKVDLCWFMPGLIKKEKTIYYPSWLKVDRCTGGVIQTVVIAPSMGAYSTLQECELPQSVHFFSSVNKNFQRSTIKILNQSPKSLLSPSCARFCSDCSPNQQGDLLMPACSDVSNGEQSGVKVLTLLSHPFLGHYLETGGCCAAILISRALLLFDM